MSPRLCSERSETKDLSPSSPAIYLNFKEQEKMAKQKIPTKFKQKAMMEKMMQERKTPSSPARKKINWKKFFKELPGKIAKFFRDVVHELKRVSWPTKKELWKYTVVVLVAIAFFAVLLGVFDFIWVRLVEYLAKI
jgi:preprotein translocase subunit SecE